jgi:uncharacterized membrane protein/mono/diheme cytochrome c family protein
MMIPSRQWKLRLCWMLPLFLLAFTPGGLPAADAAAAASESFDWAKFLAPFHSVVLHYPIGFVTMAVILECLSFFNRSVEIRRIIVLVMGLAAFSAVLSAAFGIFRSGAGEYDPQMLNTHKWSGISVTLLCLAGFALVFAASRANAARPLLAVHRVLLVGNLTVLVIAGHLGGNLTHGRNYLLEGAPEFIKALLEEKPAAAGTVSKDEAGRYFTEEIEPVLRAKCYACHGPEKQRGGYRLDDPAIALKGGDSEEVAVVPGSPMESNLIRLILLPEDDDDVMPPSGKSPLTPEEIGRLIAWVRSGAVMPALAPAAVGAN